MSGSDPVGSGAVWAGPRKSASPDVTWIKANPRRRWQAERGTEARMKSLIYLTAPITVLLLASACTRQADLTGAQIFAENCAQCHGTDAKGGAMMNAPDLTTLAARHGGEFPAEYVMSTIDGLSRENTHDAMPIFGKILEQSDMEVWTDPSGTPTPTPGALIRLAEYLEGVQGS